MESSATKRRKLSPSTSMTGTAPNNGGRPTSLDGVPSSGHRASFISPTKASLSRFNPDLLTRGQSSERQRPPRRENPNVRTRTFNVNNGENVSNGATVRTGIGQPAARANDEPDDGNGVPAPRNRLSASPKRRSKTLTVQHTPSKLPQTEPAPGLRPLPSEIMSTASRPESNTTGNSRSAATRGDRPLNGVTIDKSTIGKLPHTPTHHGVPPGADKSDDLGPSLPSTPSQLGLEAPFERPKGLLFAKRNKGTKNGHMGPSPSRSKEPVAKQSPMERPLNSTLGSKIFLPGLPTPAPTLLQADLQKKVTSRTQVEKEALSSGSSYLEDVLFSSWQNPGGKETAGQQRQRKKLTEISNKLLRLREEIDHLQSSIGEIEDVPRDQTVQLDAANPSEPSTCNSMNLPQMLSQFFPFSRDNNATPVGATPNSVALCTGETVQIRNSWLLNDHVNDPEALLQRHDAEYLSNGSVLVALQITIESKTVKVHYLRLLGQSSFSPQELQTWTDDNANSKQLTSIGTAINRCSYVVERRAACWRLCFERHPDLVVETSSNQSNLYDKHTITFQRQLLSLSITWAIRLREEGEAESKLSVLVDLPPAWLDEGIVSGSEGQNVREAFNLLVKERGVIEAVTVIVKLLFQPD